LSGQLRLKVAIKNTIHNSMPAIRSVSELAEKYKRVTPERAPYYQAGIEKPKKDWASEAAAAAEAYAGGVTAAAREGRYQKGVQAAGTGTWKERTITKGVNMGRWAQGVSQYSDNWAKGFSPFAETIARVSLPPRYPKGDPRNLERVKAIASALREKKLEQLKA
jgi:hypothetical protein